jgi:hypothetical protein
VSKDTSERWCETGGRERDHGSGGVWPGCEQERGRERASGRERVLFGTAPCPLLLSVPSPYFFPYRHGPPILRFFFPERVFLTYWGPFQTPFSPSGEFRSKAKLKG